MIPLRINTVSPVSKVVDRHDRLTEKPKVRRYVIEVDADCVQPFVRHLHYDNRMHKMLSAIEILSIRELK